MNIISELGSSRWYPNPYKHIPSSSRQLVASQHLGLVPCPRFVLCPTRRVAETSEGFVNSLYLSTDKACGVSVCCIGRPGGVRLPLSPTSILDKAPLAPKQAEPSLPCWPGEGPPSAHTHRPQVGIRRQNVVNVRFQISLPPPYPDCPSPSPCCPCPCVPVPSLAFPPPGPR